MIASIHLSRFRGSQDHLSRYAGLGCEADQGGSRSEPGEGAGHETLTRPASHGASVRITAQPRNAGEVNVRPIVLAAGGTGGHFFPAEALAAELIGRGHRIVLMTDARSEIDRSPIFAAHERFVLPGGGIAGRGVLRAASAAAGLAAGVARARAILARLDARAVVAFGGYPSIAPVLGARLLRQPRPVLLHEQNAVLGRANRFLARHAKLLASSFPATARVPRFVTTEITGNPVRPAIAALADRAYAPPRADGELRLLVLGGSLGARIFSDVVPAALALLPDPLRARLAVAQQCRAEDIERVRAAYTAFAGNAELAPFFTDIAGRLAAAHLVIARAGASTVAELAIAGRPAVLVPLPGAIDDHQSANARALATAGGAIAMAQHDFTPPTLARHLTSLLAAPHRLADAAAAARRLARPAAAARLADLCLGVAQQETVR